LREKYQSYVENLILATHDELASIKERERLLAASLPDDILELRGLAITNLRLDLGHQGGAEASKQEFSVRLVRADSSKSMPSGGWRPGMLVTVALIDADKVSNVGGWRTLDGILTEVNSSGLSVGLNNLGGWVLDSLLGVTHTGSVRVMKRSEERLYTNSIKQLRNLLEAEINLDTLPPAKFIFENILKTNDENVKNRSEVNRTEENEEMGDRDIMSESQTPGQILRVYNKKLLLDESKKRALLSCAQCPPVSIIQGPPGTGKTTCLAAAVLSHVASGLRVLVVTPSHAACDAITLALAEHWPGDISGQVVRLGNKLRLTSRHVSRFLPEYVARCRQLEEVEQQLAWVRRQLLDSLEDRREMAGEEKQLVHRHREVYRSHEGAVVSGARVVTCTLQTAMRRSLLDGLSSGQFPVLAVDEAGFCLSSQLAPVLCRARSLVMAGDHLQLPPVVLSQEALDRGLGVSLMQQLATHCPETVSLLTTQYRSHEMISGWSSQHFYSGLLSAHPSNASIGLEKLLGNTGLLSLLSRPLTWLDTRGAGPGWEEEAEGEDSLANTGEAVTSLELVTRLLGAGLGQENIGVISPYWAQVATIRSLLWETEGLRGVEVRTVDGYQGREKEVIILSMVRANKTGEVGFLTESRRINVSVTRAKRACIVIGDSETLRHDAACDSLWRYCHQRGGVRSVLEL